MPAAFELYGWWSKWSMSLPHFCCSFYFFQAKLGKKLGKGIQMEFSLLFVPCPHVAPPAPHFALPAPRFAPPAPTFCSSCPMICSSSPRDMLILASWSRHLVWSLSRRPESIPMPMSSLSFSIMSPGYNWMKLDQQKQNQYKITCYCLMYICFIFISMFRKCSLMKKLSMNFNIIIVYDANGHLNNIVMTSVFSLMNNMLITQSSMLLLISDS